MPRRARDPWSLLAAAAAFLLPVAYSPSVFATFWSPKAAVLLVAGGVGLTRLPALLRGEHRRAAWGAVALLAIASASTAISVDPVAAVVGRYNAGTGLVFIACLVGMWGLGAAARDQQLVRGALLAGIVVSCAVAVLQTVLDLGLPALEASGRASGLAGNAVHLGTVATMGIALLARVRTPVALGGIVLCGVALQLSGTRLALLVTLAVVLVLGVRDGVARLGILLAAVVVSVVLGTVIADVGGTQTATARSDDRALAAGGGVRVRLDVWAYSRHAVLERPVLGHGPGRFLGATVGDRTLSVASAEGAEAIYADGHNLLVEHAVTTGLLGVAALVAWLVGAFALARGALAAAAVAALLMGLGQPESVGTTPLLFLALGASGPPLAAVSRRATWLAPAVAGSVAAVAAVALLTGDVLLLNARNDLDTDVAEQADRLLRPWPQPATIAARAHRFESIHIGEGDELTAAKRRSRAWLEEAVDRDRADPGPWLDLADAELGDGELDAALRHYEHALRLDPWAVRAMVAFARVARDEGDEPEARRWFERALSVRERPALRRELERVEG